MPIDQHTVDLFNLALPALRHLASEAGVQVPATATKADIVLALDGVPREVIDAAASDLLYAGNTSITWLKYGEGSIEPEELRRQINELEGSDALSETLRPAQVGPIPQLVEARELEQNKLFLTFVVSKRVQTVIHNFELKRVFADFFFQVIVRYESGVFEVRTGAERARLFARTWLQTLAERSDVQVAVLAVTQEDFDALRGELGGVLDAYRGKDTAGSIYDTREYSRSDTCDDLSQEAQFLNDSEDLSPVSSDIVFEHDGDRIRLRLTSTGALWFRSVVPESVIELVYQALRKIGAL